MKIKARELQRRRGKTNCKQSNTKDTMICLPEFGFQTKPMSPLWRPKGLGLFQPSSYFEDQTSHITFLVRETKISARYFTCRSLLLALHCMRVKKLQDQEHQIATHTLLYCTLQGTITNHTRMVIACSILSILALGRLLISWECCSSLQELLLWSLY